MGKLLTFDLQRAVFSSQLDQGTRHLLMTMALLANGKTGVGFAGQETIARAMGCTARQVRYLLAELAKRTDSPIDVIRRRRSGPSGRTSDEYTLRLVQAEQPAGSNGEPNRNDVPVTEPPQQEQPAASPPDPTGKPRRANRKKTVSQPEQCSRDQLSISLCDQPSTSLAPSRSKEKPPSNTHLLKLHYVAEFKARTGEDPDFGEQWSRATQALSKLCSRKAGLEGATTIVSNALRNEYCQRILPWEIVQDAPKHQGKGRVAIAKRGGPVAQHGVAGGVDMSGKADWLESESGAAE